MPILVYSALVTAVLLGAPTSTPTSWRQDAPLAQAQEATKRAAPTRWWEDEATIKVLKLSKGQCARIKAKFDAWVPKQRSKVDELHEAERIFDEATAAPTIDHAAATKSLERLEDLKSQVSRSRNLMLLSLLMELTSEQRQTLKTLGSDGFRRGKQKFVP